MKSNFAIGAKEVCAGRRATYLLIDYGKNTSKKEIQLMRGASPANPDEQGEVKGERNIGTK